MWGNYAECFTYFDKFLNRVKYAYAGLVSGLNQFSLVPQLPQKIVIHLKKKVKCDSKIIISFF